MFYVFTRFCEPVPNVFANRNDGLGIKALGAVPMDAQATRHAPVGTDSDVLG